MFVLTDFNDIVLLITTDLTFDEFENPLCDNGTKGIMKELVKMIYENVQDVPEDINEQIYYYDGAEWRVPN